jgi:hypothetical protein
LVSSGGPPALIWPFRTICQTSPWTRSGLSGWSCRSRRSSDVRLVRVLAVEWRSLRHIAPLVLEHKETIDGIDWRDL